MYWDKFLLNTTGEIKKDKVHDRVYKIHKYWSRKPWYSIQDHISKYTEENQLVFDPFSGSGVMGIESMLLGRSFQGSDLNPIALKIARETSDYNYDIKELKKEIDEIQEILADKILKMYKSARKCETCDSFLYFKDIDSGPKFNGEYEGRLYCPNCSNTRTIKNVYLNLKEKEYINQINKMSITKWVPKTEFPIKFYKDRFSYKGINKVTDLYTHRNLLALSILLDEIENGNYKYKSLYLIAFSDTVLHSSKLKSQNVRPLGVNNYWIPDDYIEENVLFRFNQRLNNAIVSKESLLELLKDKNLKNKKIKFINKSATDYDLIEKFDYCITDPPYGDAIQYSELSFVWNAWIDKEYVITDEIIINPVQEKTNIEFRKLLNESLENIYQVLKPNAYFTMCFQNKNFNIWKEIILKTKGLGFSLVDIKIYKAKGNSFNSNWAKYRSRSDIYVTFKKGKSTKNIDIDFSKFKSIESLLSSIININHSEKLANDRIYDLLVVYLIWYMYEYNQKIENYDFDIKKIFSMIEKIQKEVEIDEFQNNI